MGIYAIGDIHGEIDKLKALIDTISPTNGDRLIFLGDYIDRGTESRRVVEYLIQLRADVDCVFLMGTGAWITWGGGPAITSEQGKYPLSPPWCVEYTIPYGQEYYTESNITIAYPPVRWHPSKPVFIAAGETGERQGPGGDAETKLAMKLAGLDRTRPLKIVDIGCGTGASTILLAKELDAEITAVDSRTDESNFTAACLPHPKPGYTI